MPRLTRQFYFANCRKRTERVIQNGIQDFYFSLEHPLTLTELTLAQHWLHHLLYKTQLEQYLSASDLKERG